MLLEDHVVDAIARALDGLVDEVPTRDELASWLGPTPDPAMGDLAFKCFPLAKAMRKSPPAIAAELAERVRPAGPIERVEAAGPYLNVHADAAGLLARVLESLEDGSFDRSLESGEPARVMIEFSQPNTHKVFHVGHLRNVALGDCLVRAFRARGHDVVAANYYGDFGIDVAKCLWWLRAHPEATAPERDRCTFLGEAYARATARFEEARAEGEEDAAELARAFRTVLGGMKGDDPAIRELYERTRRWCLDEFAEIYRWLGVGFDHEFYESDLEEPGQRIVDEYVEKGVFVPSRGAIICDLESEGLGAALVRKSDGSSLYLTWDLVLAREKFERFGVERSIYVVGSEQSLHFRQLFATLARMGYERAGDCRHVAYELVMLPEGKMSSRRGKAIPLYALRREVEAAIDQRIRASDRPRGEGWGEAEHAETLRRIAVACLRYGMLRVGNTTRVVFDLDAWTNPEGDSGAYLLYGLARISGIFRKGGRPAAGELARALEDARGFGAPAERALLAQLLRYPRVLAAVERDADPSALAGWLYETTRGFSRFYHECPVLKADAGLREARLGLVAATEAILGRGLRVLGVEPVEAM